MSIAATIGAVGSIAGGAIGAVGASSAANAQVDASKSAAQLQAEQAQKALDFQKQQWETQQKNEAPFLAAGTQAANTLAGLTSTPGEGLLTPWTKEFHAPTAEEAAQTPGYKFQLEQGNEALQRSAVASGGLLTGGTAKALDQFSQGLASSNYQQTFQNALQQYSTAYNTFQNNQTNTFNRLASQEGIGQTTAATLGQEGAQASGNAANILLTSGAQQGQALQNAGAATASGYVGVSNALGGAVQGVGNALSLQQLMSQGNRMSGDINTAQIDYSGA